MREERFHCLTFCLFKHTPPSFRCKLSRYSHINCVRVDINSYTLSSPHHHPPALPPHLPSSLTSPLLAFLLPLSSLSLFTSCSSICPSCFLSSIPPKFLSQSHSHSITPHYAFPHLCLFPSPPCSPYISTPPTSHPFSLCVVTAACLMVQLLLSRSTTRRPGEQQPRLTPPNRWTYQD